MDRKKRFYCNDMELFTTVSQEVSEKRKKDEREGFYSARYDAGYNENQDFDISKPIEETVDANSRIKRSIPQQVNIDLGQVVLGSTIPEMNSDGTFIRDIILDNPINRNVDVTPLEEAKGEKDMVVPIVILALLAFAALSK